MPLLRARSSALGTGLLSAVLASILLLPAQTGGAEGDLSRAFFDMSLRELDGAGAGFRPQRPLGENILPERFLRQGPASQLHEHVVTALPEGVAFPQSCPRGVQGQGAGRSPRHSEQESQGHGGSFRQGILDSVSRDLRWNRRSVEAVQDQGPPHDVRHRARRKGNRLCAWEKGLGQRGWEKDDRPPPRIAPHRREALTLKTAVHSPQRTPIRSGEDHLSGRFRC